MTLSEWADTHRRLSSEASAEPGRWQTDRAPYLRGIMDAITDPLIERVVLMKSAQTGGTEVILNAIGYYIDQDPSPLLLIQPTLEMAQAFSKDRLAPMLRDTPQLQGRVKDARARDSGNTMLHKTFPGGHITMAGANSPASLASRPIRVTLFDEVDRFPPSAGTEGDPVSLGRKRSRTFWNRKSVEVSTPTVKGVSRIESSYSESDQRHYHIPCPHCGHSQRLVWANVKWDTVDGKALPDTARYKCEACELGITDVQRLASLRHGEWVSDNAGHAVAGFHISELYSPWSSLSDIVAAFLEAKPKPDTLRTWINTCLGETWEEQASEQLEASTLADRLREEYPAPVPDPVTVLTCFVDVQRDRLEAEVVGWAPTGESWSIDYRVLDGIVQYDQVWADLDDYLQTKWQHESGAQIGISITGVDSGDSTERVYAWVKPRERRRVYATKGRGGQALPVIVQASRRNKRKVKLYTLGVDNLKSSLYARLRLIEAGPGYCHFPHDRPEHYFEMLTAEKARTKYVQGRPVIEWFLPSGARNEALDCRVGNMAMLEILKPNWIKVRERLLADKAAPVAQREPEKPKSRPRPARKRGGFVNGWRM